MVQNSDSVESLREDLSGMTSLSDFVTGIRERRRTEQNVPPLAPADETLQTTPKIEAGEAAAGHISLSDFIDTRMANNTAPEGSTKRLQELKNETPILDTSIGRQAEDHGNGGIMDFAGNAVDFAGNVVGTQLRAIGKALSYLDVPAEGVERTLGMVYFNEVGSVADRWAMGSLTYDSMWDNWFGNGDSGRYDIIEQYQLGATFEELREDNDSAWGNAIGHMALDPLWLLGGVPLLTKVPIIGGTQVMRAANRGINFAKIPGVRNIPVIGNIGARVTDVRVLNPALAEFNGTAKTTAEMSRSGGLRGLFSPAPQNIAGEELDAVKTVASFMTSPDEWKAANGAGYQQFLRDLQGGGEASRLLPAHIYNNSTPMKTMRRLSENEDIAAVLSNMHTFQEIKTPARTLKMAQTAVAPIVDKLKAGTKLTASDAKELEIFGQEQFWRRAQSAVPDVMEKLRDGVTLTAGENRRYADFRAASVLEELYQRISPILNDVNGVKPGLGFRGGIAQAGSEVREGHLLEAAESLGAAFKVPLSLMLLNTPRFVFLNYGNNAAHMGVKTEKVSNAFNYIRHPLRGASAKELERSAEAGFGPLLTKQLAMDDAYWRELSGRDELSGIVQTESVKHSFWSLFMNKAQDLDQGMREGGHIEGVSTVVNSVWRSVDEGGVIPNLPEILKGEEAVQDAVMAIGKGDSVSILEEFGEFTQDIDLTTGHTLIENFARTDKNSALILRELPGSMGDDVTDILDIAKAARKVGADGWQENMLNSLDDLADATDLATFRARLADQMQDVPIPMTTIAGKVVPWQDLAHLERYTNETTALLGRMMTAHSPQLVGTEGSVAVLIKELGRITNRQLGLSRGAMEEVSRIRMGAPGAPDALKNLQLKRMQFLDERNKDILDLVSDSPALRVMMNDFIKGERELFARHWRLRTSSTVASHAGHVREVHVGELGYLDDFLNSKRLVKNTARTVVEGVVAGRAVTQTADLGQRFLRHARPKILKRINSSKVLTKEQLNALSKYSMQELRPAMNAKNMAASIVGRHMSDFVALNYSRKYGMDGAAMMLYPYAFWPTRTLMHWAQMTQARPGFTAAYTRLYDMIAEINEEEGIPDRIKNAIQINIPFMPDWMETAVTGSNGPIFVDPIKILYPLASFQDPISSDGLSAAGKAMEFSQSVGVGASPFITGPLGATGALGDREQFIRRGLAVPAMPFGVPGPRIARAITDWLTGVSDSPSPELTDEIKQQIVNKEPLDEDILSRAFREIIDYSTSDGFDEYRLSRTLASMVGEDPQRWSAKAGLEALKYRTGPLYDEAKRRSKTERGLSVLTGWLIMPLRVYPEGEQVMRGLDTMYREVRDTGDDDAINEFFAAHPEYQVRQVAVADRDDGSQQQEVDTTLFFMDMAEVEDRYDPKIMELQQVIRAAERADYLTTVEGRRLLKVMSGEINTLTEAKQAEMSQLNALYPNKLIELSLKAAPEERALFELRSEFFDISRDDYTTQDEFTTARDKFVSDMSIDAPPLGAWSNLAAEAATIHAEFQDRIAATPDGQKRPVVERRDALLRTLTSTARGLVSRAEFQMYLGAGRTAPTPARLEYNQAKSEIAEYRAIKDSKRLTPGAIRQLSSEYWKSHPLLAKHYGRDEPTVARSDTDLARTYDRMDVIWTNYFGVEGSAKARRDWLSMNLDELNQLRAEVGLEAIHLKNERELIPGQMQQTPTDPHEAALQQERLNR